MNPSQPQPNQPETQSTPAPTQGLTDLRSRVSRCYVEDREFKDQSTGRLVKYSKLIVEFIVDGDTIEYGVSVKKTDKVLLRQAEDFSKTFNFNS